MYACVSVHVDAKHAKGDVSISTKPRVNLKVRAGVIHAHDNTDCWVVNFRIRYVRLYVFLQKNNLVLTNFLACLIFKEKSAFPLHDLKIQLDMGQLGMGIVL